MKSTTPRSLRRLTLGALAVLAVAAAPTAALAVTPWGLETTLTNADAPGGSLKPWFVVPSPKGDVVYLSTTSGPTIFKLDPKTNTITGSISLPGGTGSSRLVLDPSGRYLYAQVRNPPQSNTLYKIDTTNDTVVGTVPFVAPNANYPGDLAIDPTGAALYSTTYTPTVGKTDLATGTTTSIILADANQTQGLAFSPDGRYLYVSYHNQYGSGSPHTGVRRIDLTDPTNPSSQTDWLIDPARNTNVGSTEVSADGRILYVWTDDFGDLYEIDTTTGAIITTIDAGTGCGTAYCAWGVSRGLAISPTGKYAIALQGGGTAVDNTYAWLIDLTRRTSTPLSSASGFHNGPNNIPEFAAFGPETTCKSTAYIQNDPDWNNQANNPGTIDIIRAVAGPCAPTNVAATPGADKLDVSFTAPDDGGSPITGYEYSLDGGTTWKSTGSTDTRFTISGLKGGTAYTVTVRAINAAAPGAVSAQAAATPSVADQTPSGASPAITMPAASVTKGATLTTVVNPSVAGTVKVTATLRGRTMCTATKKATRAGRMTVTCTLRPAAQAAIRRQPVTLRVSTRLTDAAGKTATASRNVKVARYVVRTPVTG